MAYSNRQKVPTRSTIAQSRTNLQDIGRSQPVQDFTTGAKSSPAISGGDNFEKLVKFGRAVGKKILYYGNRIMHTNY